MKDGISIIIPCYNVEKYLMKCLDQIMEQTFQNLEIILIDDHSTDRTAEIMKSYQKKCNRLQLVFNEQNHGAGYSRNRGLEKAKYDYISFIDADDFIEANYYQELWDTMKKEKADVVLCDIFVRYQNSNYPDSRSPACYRKDIKYSAIHNGLAASPCNKLFKKKDLQKYPFAEGMMNEDVPTVLPILYHAKKIGYTENTCYNYVQHDNSMQNSSISEKRFDIFKAMDLLEERMIPYVKDNKYWNAIIYNQVIMFLIYVIPKEPSFHKRCKVLKQYYQLSKKYKIRQNHLLWDFLESQGTKHKYYYKALLKLNDNGYSILASSLISFYHGYSKQVKKSVIKEQITLEDLIDVAKKQQKKKKRNFTLSVAVPNYNYDQFLYQRIYSILYQTEKIDELCILDDCSKDNSRETIDLMVEALSPYINVKKVYNEKNSGSAFRQWKKGFEVATGDYVWIAEADDYSDRHFLKKVLTPIKKDPKIILSYANTAYIDRDGIVIYRSIIPEIDIMKTEHWKKDYVSDGVDEIKNYAFLNCTIANVSSVIFKNGNYADDFRESGKYKQAGDWLFYINLMSRGKVAFCKKALNYYRVHGSNVTSTTKKKAHLEEIKRVHQELDQKMKLTAFQKKKIQGRYKFLEKVWNIES